MIGLHGITVSLITTWIFCQKAQTESCEDPGWCARLGDAFCKGHSVIKESCKSMCGECEASEEETHCPDISPIVNGDIIASSKPPYEVGTTANFTCKAGFEVRGESGVICLKNGEWSDKIPLCVETYCPDTTPIVFGDTITSSTPPYKVGTTVNFTCHTGYRGSGQTTIICLSNGEWSDDTPYCTPSVCKRDKKKLEEGRTCQPRCVRGSCKNNFYTCRCDDWCGKSCFNPQATCKSLDAPKNGEISTSGKRYGQRVTYKCKPGYTLIGPPSRSCRSDKKWSGYDPYCVPFSACGFTEKHTQDRVRVVHGKDAKKGAWPWQVALIKSQGYSVEQMYKNTVVGGGSVVTDEWVLSAAHVFTGLFGMESFATSGLEIPEHIQIFEPETVILHPNFNRRSLDYDVAMVRIGKRLERGPDKKFITDESVPGGKVTFTQFVRPVCLPCMKGGVLGPADAWKDFAEDRCNQKDKSIFPSFASTGTKVVVTGFGVINPLPADGLPDERSDLPHNLQEGQINIVDPDTCARDMQTIILETPDARYTPRMFCASGGTKQEKVDACQGDSGGPVVKRMKLPRNNRVKYWMQLGIVSWGSGCASEYHGYYISVPSIMKWVWKTLDDGKKGVWGEWSQWGTCDVSCGAGEMSRSRICQGSKCDGDYLETQQCKEKSCEGEWGDWLVWTECSDVCGGGEKTRTRSCLGPESCVGDDEEEADCNTHKCNWGRWTAWKRCDVTCGGGHQERTRICLGPGDCVGHDVETKGCNSQDCEGEWSNWGPWGSCSATCGGGRMERERSCLGPGRCLGGDDFDDKDCETQLCPDTWSLWGPWSACSTRGCESGIRIRVRRCTSGSCAGDSQETVSCNNQCQGTWSSWWSWSACSAICGGGERQRIRVCRGSGCPGDRSQIGRCNTSPCTTPQSPVPWSSCSVSCGGGVKSRRIGGRLETQPCNTEKCVWTECTKPCGGGKKERKNCAWAGLCSTVTIDCNTQPC